MRKAFSFYRSFYDVFKDLPTKDKLPFIEAVLDRQFEGVEPTKLEGMAKFAYLSQKQVINSQIEGWESKMGFSLQSTACQGGSVGGSVGVTIPPSVQEKEKGKEKEQEKGKEQVVCEDIINYLNLKTESNYKHTTATTTTFIKARLAERFTVDQFKKVIDVKTAEWKGTEQEIYLRPQTLFGTKFESYLNQKSTNTPDDSKRKAFEAKLAEARKDPRFNEARW